VIAVIDAEIADQFGHLFDGRDLPRHALHLGAPAGGGIGGDNGIGDIGQLAQIGALDIVADVDDDEVFGTRIGLEPFGIDEGPDFGLGKGRPRFPAASSGIMASAATPIISIWARMPRPRFSTTMRRQPPVKPKEP
jgi:hypothetical protein